MVAMLLISMMTKSLDIGTPADQLPVVNQSDETAPVQLLKNP
jgi:hypothetical protein